MCSSDLFWYILNWTSFGRHVYAIGDDPEAAKLAGIRTDGLLLSVYAIAGFICAFAGWALIGRIGSVSPQSGYTANLDSITAVVIGGTSLFGGRGSIIGTLIGVLIMVMIRNGLNLMGVSPFWQGSAIGGIIILALLVERLVSGRAAR